MSGNPPPLQVVGTFECVVNEDGNVVLTGKNGEIRLLLKPEDAAYFTIGAEYVFSGTSRP